jgi:hypothetical protein
VNLCEECWKRMKGAIEARGLGARIKSGEQNMEELRRMLAEGAPPGDPDPLMVASSIIMNRALYIHGIGILMAGPSGKPPCPVCTLIQTCQCGRQDECGLMTWWESVADEVLNEITAYDAAKHHTSA